MIKTIETIQLKDLDSLANVYEKFKEICKTYKEIRGDAFKYAIDIDYDKQEIEITLEFKEDGNTEGSPELN